MKLSGLGRAEDVRLLDVKPSGLLWRLADVLDDVRGGAGQWELREARLFAADRFASRPGGSQLSCDRLIGLWVRFERFAGANGVHVLGEVTPALCVNGH